VPTQVIEVPNFSFTDFTGKTNIFCYINLPEFVNLLVEGVEVF